MRLVHYLQHWLRGTGTRLHVTDIVPDTHPLRQWADTFPWPTLVTAVEHSVAQRFPTRSPRGRAPVSIRVLLALELLKHAVGASDEEICHRLRTDFAVMYACGLREYQAPRSQEPFVLPETLWAFRRRIDETLMEALLALQAAAAMEEGLVSPAPLVIDTFPCEQGSQRVTDATTLSKAQKKTLVLIERIIKACHCPDPALTSRAQSLQQELKKVLRCFGRQCRGPGHVFVTLVRQPERQLLALGQPIHGLGQHAQQLLAQAHELSAAHRARWTSVLTMAVDAHTHISKQSQQLTQGKKLRHGKIVNAYDSTLAPIIKGKRNCPTQVGRKAGLVSEPATGCIFANRVPEGNPSDAGYVLPLLDKVQGALTRVQTAPRLQVHSVAGDRGFNEATLRQALHARGILTIGIPKTVASIQTNPSPRDIFAILNAAGLHRKRTPHHVHLACACG